MFTGIIEGLGRVKNFQKKGVSFRLQFEAENIFEGVKIGDSIAVNGACLTIVGKDKNCLEFDILGETAARSNLGSLKIGEKVNLERALKVGDRLSGHFVNGHVDCTGIVLQKIYKNNNLGFVIRFPSRYIKYVVEKGSVAVDGISLTIAQIKSNSFTVYIIPHTLQNTTLQFKGPSHLVNLEFDILLKSRE